MSQAVLVVTQFGEEPREIEIVRGVTSLGRVPDNAVSLAGDSNVSRYHAEIERRGNDFYLIDLNSSNGTFVNGEPVVDERRLQDGDSINLGGGESSIEFRLEVEAPAALNDSDDSSGLNPDAAQAPDFPVQTPATSAASGQAAAPQSSSKLPLMLGVAAVLGGLAIVAVVAAILVLRVEGSCVGEVSILRPESGETISEATEIKVEAKNTRCIERVVYRIDGEEIASAEVPPYSLTLEPENLAQFDDDNSHVLTVTVVNRSGEQTAQKDEILLAFEVSGSKNSDKKSEELNEPNQDEPTTPIEATRAGTKQASLLEIKEMSERFVKQFSGGASYKLGSQFLQQVQARTAEYKVEGYSSRAAAYRDAINVAFVGEQGLDVPLGYVLAMSRSKFDLKKGATNPGEEGLWRMTNEFVTSSGYNGQCGTETLSDPKQTCAARAAAIYTKALVVNLFEGDVLYGVSTFGMSPQEAGNFKISLPPDRSDFWNVIKSPKQRDNLVRFFAAGIVAENPQKFGLKRDQPLSNLYRNLIILK